MQKIKAKLNGKRGVSLMMALLLFLLCALSGAAALTAAGSNIGRYSYMRTYQQEYFSVSSAATLLKTQFEQGSGNITADYSGSPNPTLDYGGLTDSSSHVYGLMNNEITSLFKYVYQTKSGGSPSPYSPSEVKFDVEADGFDKVEVTVKPINLSSDCNSADMDVELSCGEHTLVFTAAFTLSYEESTQTVTATAVKVERITLPK